MNQTIMHYVSGLNAEFMHVLGQGKLGIDFRHRFSVGGRRLKHPLKALSLTPYSTPKLPAGPGTLSGIRARAFTSIVRRLLISFSVDFRQLRLHTCMNIPHTSLTIKTLYPLLSPREFHVSRITFASSPSHQLVRRASFRSVT